MKKNLNQTKRAKAEIVTALNYVSYLKSDDKVKEDKDKDGTVTVSGKMKRYHEICAGFSDGMILTFILQTTSESLKSAWKVKKEPPFELVWRPDSVEHGLAGNDVSACKTRRQGAISLL